MSHFYSYLFLHDVPKSRAAYGMVSNEFAILQQAGYGIRPRRMIKDLACLDKVAKYQLNQTQRLFFFKEYMRKSRLGTADKAMIRRILRYFRGRE